jgi:RNA polymerase sigma factor (sigma-70 family)
VIMARSPRIIKNEIILADYWFRRVFIGGSMMTDSQQLLAAYVKTGSESAFRELLTRYIDLVYSTALRMVGGDAHRAEDVAQTVFTDLAREAHKLSPDTMLGGWLHRDTCFVAGKLMRTERRRQVREQQATEMNALDQSENDFEHLGPVLDEVINELPETDRMAILLRFYERRDLRSIGEALGSSENAAQKRVARALDQLHGMLTRRGIVLSVAVLTTALATKAVTAAPAGLFGTIATVALSGSPITTATVIAATKTVTMTTLQKVAIVTTFAIVAGAGVQQTYQATRLRSQIHVLQQERTSMSGQIQQLQQERDDAANSPAAEAGGKGNDAELLRLRAEVGALREAARGRSSTDSVVQEWAARITSLKQKLDQMPDKRIPELAFITDEDWAAAARDANLDTDDGVRQALERLRNAAKNNFFNAVRVAIKKYASAVNGSALSEDVVQYAKAVNANPNLWPSELAQLKPYFGVPVDDALFQRYQFTPPVKLHENQSDIFLKEIAPPVDPEYDTHQEIGLSSGSSRSINLIQDAVAAAAKDYTQANNGQQPTDPAQITPYLKSPIDISVVQKYLSKVASANR